MNLLDENDVTVLIAVDDPEFPQRPGPIERPHHEVGAQLSQLSLRARNRKDYLIHMIRDVEVGIVGPDRTPETEWTVNRTLAKTGYECQSLFDQFAQIVQTNTSVSVT